MFAVQTLDVNDVLFWAVNKTIELGHSERRTRGPRYTPTVAVKTKARAGACRNIVNSESGSDTGLDWSAL